MIFFWKKNPDKYADHCTMLLPCISFLYFLILSAIDFPKELSFFWPLDLNCGTLVSKLTTLPAWPQRMLKSNWNSYVFITYVNVTNKHTVAHMKQFFSHYAIRMYGNFFSEDLFISGYNAYYATQWSSVMYFVDLCDNSLVLIKCQHFAAVENCTK